MDDSTGGHVFHIPNLVNRTRSKSWRLPVPIRYPGMPSDRYWEFEDGSVNLANPKGGPTAITMMLVLEYELVASNDWFQVPIELVDRFFALAVFP